MHPCAVVTDSKPASPPGRAPGADAPRSRDLRVDAAPGERPLGRPVLQFDLRSEADALRQEQGWSKTGHSAKTLVKHHDLRTVLIAMKKGTRMSEHQAAGATSIQLLEGRLALHIGSETLDVRAGNLVALDRELSHDVEAVEDAAFILSVVQAIS
jgi:quercetin dioxygenase-like cupin family protein